MILSLAKFLIILYVLLLITATLTWNYRPTMYVNAKYDIVSKTNINTLKENGIYVCQHVSRITIFEQMIMCEDVKKSTIKFNIVAGTGVGYQKFFKMLPKFTCYNLITLKNKGNSNTTNLIEEILIDKKENVLFFLSEDKDRKGIYHILKETKKPLILINMIEKENKNSTFNKKFILDYRIMENYPIDKKPEDFMKWLKGNLYNYYDKLDKQYII